MIYINTCWNKKQYINIYIFVYIQKILKYIDFRSNKVYIDTNIYVYSYHQPFYQKI